MKRELAGSEQTGSRERTVYKQRRRACNVVCQLYFLHHFLTYCLINLFVLCFLGSLGTPLTPL